MRVTSSVLAFGGLLTAALPAAAAPGDPIGSAVVVVNQVTAELSRDVRTLVKGDRVRHSELITAGSDGRTELKLDDETKLALGPGAKLLLDKFVYDPDKTGGAIVINMAKGAFRFITGVAAKPAYIIRTPQAAITVRGTIFDVFVRESGETWLLLSEGGVQVCNDRGLCKLHQEPGRLLKISDNGAVGSPVCWSRFEIAPGVSFDEAFPFVVSPPSIDTNPVFTRASIESNDQCARATKERRTERATEPRVKRYAKVTLPKIETAAVKVVKRRPVVTIVKVTPPKVRWPRPGRIVIRRPPVDYGDIVKVRLPIRRPRPGSIGNGGDKVHGHGPTLGPAGGFSRVRLGGNFGRMPTVR